MFYFSIHIVQHQISKNSIKFSKTFKNQLSILNSYIEAVKVQQTLIAKNSLLR